MNMIVKNKRVKSKISCNNFLSENRKGVSAVVITMLMVLLVVAAASIIWVAVNNLVKGGTGSSKSCYDILGKITLNSEYTCYNNSNDRVLFSINIGDAEIDELLVSIANERNSTLFKLSNEETVIANLMYYKGIGGNPVKLPGKNAGKTYIATSILEKPLKIEIAAIIKEKACESSDSLTDIPSCSALSL